MSYMRRKHSDEARALADLLTRQCIEMYRDHCSSSALEWRARFLAEQGLTTEAAQLVTKRLESCRDESERERLQKVLRGVERKAGPTATPKSRPSHIPSPAPVHQDSTTAPVADETPPVFPEGWVP